ncbi:hypothetical protein V6N12_045424 [Hibiscus sabdariffa]|uniref:Uncharacterized protein n=1 Tax=Hibiscus sabdariffa TaxID=183260 RepID=A0ABR2G2P6_9ROSI
MSITGENVNVTLSSSTESPKELEKTGETPTSGTKKRKGKKPVEDSTIEGGGEENIDSKALVCLDVETRWNSTYSMLKSALVFKKAFRNMKTRYLPSTKELKKVGGAPNDED